MKIDAGGSYLFKNAAQGADKINRESLRDACRDFEAFMIGKMMETMRRSAPKSDLFGDTRARDTYQAMLDEKMAISLARSGGMGLGDELYRKLSRHV